MSERTQRGQMQELNWIRGLSALFIVLYHYTYQYQVSIGHVDTWPVTVPWGCGAVNVFFLLTGFLTMYALKLGSSPLQFAWKRAKRLYPAYWICIVLTSIVMVVFLPEYLRSIKVILINFTMLQNFIGITNVDGVYWTLSYELIFYFYVFILLFFKKATWKWIRNFALAWIAVSFVYYGLESRGFANSVMSVWRLALMPYFAAPFAGGMLLATVAKEGKRDFISYGGVLVSFVLSLLVQELSYAVLYCIAGILLFVTIEKRFVSHNEVYLNCLERFQRYLKPLAFVASISYPLYLLHQFIGFAVIKGIESVGLTNELFIVIPIGLLLCLAFAVQKTVDRIMSLRKRKV